MYWIIFQQTRWEVSCSEGRSLSVFSSWKPLWNNRKWCFCTVTPGTFHFLQLFSSIQKWRTWHNVLFVYHLFVFILLFVRNAKVDTTWTEFLKEKVNWVKCHMGEVRKSDQGRIETWARGGHCPSRGCDCPPNVKSHNSPKLTKEYKLQQLNKK